MHDSLKSLKFELGFFFETQGNGILFWVTKRGLAIPLSMPSFILFLFFQMASQLLRSTLRAIARPSLVKSFVAPSMTQRMPTVAFTATRSFSAGITRMSNGVGKV